MRRLVELAVSLSLWLFASGAYGWDGPKLWYEPAHGAIPGGGGVIGTGGKSNFGVHCAHCHIDAQGKIGADVSFDPPLPMMGNQPVYAPGQTYQVTVSLIGEYLGMSGCGEYGMNLNAFAAGFEDADGGVVGRLATDSGFSSDDCVSQLPAEDPPGTVVTWGDCKAVVPLAMENVTSWTFSWTAPASGSGPITMFYGVTDGNCMMDSFDDDTVVKTLVMGEASALGSGAPGWRYAVLLLPLVLFNRRRRTRCALRAWLRCRLRPPRRLLGRE